MEADITNALKFGITLLSIINPIGAIPIFLGITIENSQDEIKSISSSCSIAVVITMLVSLFFGQKILSFFGISIASFRIGGGILLFTMALSMISAKSHNSKINKSELETQDPGEIGIVPLAIPLLAGPGAISTSIIEATTLEGVIPWVSHIFIILIIGILVKTIFNFSRAIGNKMGTLGVNVLTRVMGLILMALSIEFMAFGIREMFGIVLNKTL